MTAKRILVVITPETAGDLRGVASSAAALARQGGGVVRLAYVCPIPRPRVDRYDRVISDVDREMARLGAAADETLRALHGELGGVQVERVVRFGRLAAELAIEAQAWTADLIGLAAPARPGLRHALRVRYLGLVLSAPVVTLPLALDDAGDRRRQSLALPALR